MNTIHRRSAWGIAFAGFIMTATAACGSETAIAPSNISDPIQQDRTDVQHSGRGSLPGPEADVSRPVGTCRPSLRAAASDR